MVYVAEVDRQIHNQPQLFSDDRFLPSEVTNWHGRKLNDNLITKTKKVDMPSYFRKNRTRQHIYKLSSDEFQSIQLVWVMDL